MFVSNMYYIYYCIYIELYYSFVSITNDYVWERYFLFYILDE